MSPFSTAPQKDVALAQMERIPGYEEYNLKRKNNDDQPIIKRLCVR